MRQQQGRHQPRAERSPEERQRQERQLFSGKQTDSEGEKDLHLAKNASGLSNNKNSVQKYCEGQEVRRII